MTFPLFVVPALRRMLGRPDARPRYVPVALTSGPLRSRECVQYVPARLSPAPDRFTARPLAWLGSVDLVPLLAARWIHRRPGGRSAARGWSARLGPGG
ncbi:MAG: hypothetical protein HY720_21660 [Planctomycetes bacterium]|nr:hypothetical protein [Planctomycetota bacterium]